MKKIAPIFLALLLVSQCAFAASPWTEKTTWNEKALGKLGFGAANLLLGWTEIFTVPMKAEHNANAILRGIGQGFWNAAVYTGGGALHLVTFPATNLDVPLPNNGIKIS